MSIYDRLSRFSLALLIIQSLCVLSWAGTYDYNPVYGDVINISKCTFEYEDNVAGEGYMMVRKMVNTNNLSLMQFMHGSGTQDYADMLSSRQKTTHPSDDYYYINEGEESENQWKGANSEIDYAIQNRLVQAPYAFAAGTKWFAVHPVTYDSLLKEKTVAKSYQEAAMMQHQLDYARGYEGDLAVNMNCTAPTDEAKGMGLISMSIDSYVMSGMVHIGELVSDASKHYQGGYNNTKVHALKGPIIRVDENYVGNFHIKKEMEVKTEKPISEEYDDWLTCCFGGFSDMNDADRKFIKDESIFDCTCKEITTNMPA
ncbi:MAG: hypothetical protein A4E48_01185 [Methanosaeta sp. PtaU1.Bin060]|nr:MAG: hypothetical protein A4E48_01185 [Methanosaeta sp. PtaU1.Bin060]